MLSKQDKQQVLNASQKHNDDTGSAEVQIALLSVRINKLSEHLKINKKDIHSRRGLLKMVAHRKKLIKYLRNSDEKKLIQLAQKYNFKV